MDMQKLCDAGYANCPACGHKFTEDDIEKSNKCNEEGEDYCDVEFYCGECGETMCEFWEWQHIRDDELIDKIIEEMESDNG